ncbi:SDR family NAD(P)-dependent oxidoreductase [Streptomyces sp. NPDC001068]|uniref:SDR family NAD(P)-dependent oxidoreductase n=1 Tax=Streptomyces sp. NPDC001068 TaxID=3364544 RepID=UPI0036B0966C
MSPAGAEERAGEGPPTAVVTGAARGLGLHLAGHLTGRGFDVLCVVRSSADAARIGAVTMRPVVGDVRDPALGRRLAALVGDGAVDLLVHNAGVGHPPHTLRELPPDDVLESVSTHCLGPLRLTQALLPALCRSSRATVLHVSSRWGSFAAAAEDGPGARHYAYRIGKAAQNMMSLCLRQELAGHGIRVAAVHPGALRTAMGAADATEDPATAALELVRLVLAEHREDLPPFMSRAGDPHPW